MSAQDGGPAFPRQHTVADANDPAFKLGAPGMSLRDWFAGQVLTGLMANPEIVKKYAEFRSTEVQERIAGYCYEEADAMLRNREAPDA